MMNNSTMNDSTMNELMDVMPDIKFRFHVDYPTLEECYAYGYESARAGVSEDENPYGVTSHNYEQWSEGWWAGFYEDQPLFTFDAEHPEDNAAALTSANDDAFYETSGNYLLRALEIASVIAVSAILGYQVIDLVA
ncbi:MAG: transmission trait enhancer LetE [Legionella sp.]|nr:transmission trait enhancer LetE [Legionella sp.]